MMKKNNLYNILLVIICFVCFSCKAKKAIIKSPEVNAQPIESKKAALSNIINSETQFSTFSTKASTLLNINGKKYDVTLNIRIKKEEAIWISVTAIAGLEVSRIMITPDSIKIMDRMNDEYLKKPFDYIHEFTNKKISYQTIESLLIGNCIPFTLTNSSKIMAENGVLNLKGVDQNLSYQLQFNSQYKSTTTILSDVLAQQALTVNTPFFEQVLNQWLPLKVTIDSKAATKQFKVEMEYNKTQLNIPIDFPFNVPKRFSVIE
jgi:hypothetical protein